MLKKKWAILWVVRYAPIELVLGLTLFLAGSFGLHSCVEASKADLPFESVVTAFGIWPWLLTLLVGLGAILYAWNIGTGVKMLHDSLERVTAK
jgi:hypothetical protein